MELCQAKVSQLEHAKISVNLLVGEAENVLGLYVPVDSKVPLPVFVVGHIGLARHLWHDDVNPMKAVSDASTFLGDPSDEGC